MIGYTIFNVISHSMALAIMLPATFCAGMTLPLITAICFGMDMARKASVRPMRSTPSVVL